MTRDVRRRLRSALASTATALAAATLACAGLVYAQGGPDPGAPIHAAAKKKRTPALSVRGSASRLYPGATVSLPLMVRNRTRFPLALQKLRVKVRNARTGCPASMLEVQPIKTRAKVRRGRSVVVKVRVTLSRAAPDACQNAKFPLTYRVRGTARSS
ncbi:MAG TPA: hypothetical protein VF712_14955 [Thermoleophilaceae bacterium]|jgi:hypothetical protein